MKNFKVGDRVAFTYNENRYRGEIECICGPYFEIKINETIFYSVQLDEANIKRLVKKKRRVIWVNDCGNYLSSPFTNEYEAINRAKQSPTFVRTIKFMESK